MAAPGSGAFQPRLGGRHSGGACGLLAAIGNPSHHRRGNLAPLPQRRRHRRHHERCIVMSASGATQEIDSTVDREIHQVAADTSVTAYGQRPSRFAGLSRKQALLVSLALLIVEAWFLVGST